MKNKRTNHPINTIRLLLTCLICTFSFWISPQFSVLASAREDDEEQQQIGVFLPMAVNGRTLEDAPAPPVPSRESWLGYLNFYRSLANLPPTRANPDWGEGGWYHSRYMVKNDTIEHAEDPNNEWYTNLGNSAAQSSNLVASSDHAASDNYAIDAWMQAPFHALHILDPELIQVGFGSFREEDGGLQMGATLDVIHGLGGSSGSVTYPIIWPADGTTVPIDRYWGEYPDPLSSCPGYEAPAGLPVLLQLGPGDVTPEVTRHSIKKGTTSVKHCVFTETSYVNDDPAAQELGRAILDSHDAIVLIPQQPLLPGENYTVSVTANGQTYTWSFQYAAGMTQMETLSQEMFFVP